MTVRLQGQRALGVCALFFAVLFLLPQDSHAADLNLTPATASVGVGEKISIQVTLDPSGESVNAADGTISFDKSLLSVDSVNKDGSSFSLWTADPSFSNSDGTINFSGGTPSAFTSKGKIMTIVFKGKAKGDATVTFTKGSVLAADGKGTDVYKTGNGATLTVAAAAAAPPADAAPADTSSADAATGDGVPPVAPIINSPTYPKPDTWYGTSTAVFTWLLNADVTGVRTLWSDKDNDTPKVAIKGGATTTATVTGIKDGVSYFYAQFKNDSGWGDIGKFTIHVDTVPPNDFSVALQQPGTEGGAPKLAFKTDDVLSGLDHYEVMLGTSTPISARTQDVADGTYPVPPNPGGMTHVTIKAYDKAGNVKEAVADLALPAVAKPKPPSAAEDTSAVPVSSTPIWLIILAVLLAMAVGALLTLNMRARKLAAKEKEILLQAVIEVRDKNDRIFSAMREEFEQMVNTFDVKPQLTPEERELLEGIKEVLDISEELVDTSIEDLKKMIRNQP